jgi:hypothetical protein
MALWYAQVLATRDTFAWAAGSHTVEYATAHAWLEDEKSYVDVYLNDYLRAASWEPERMLVWPVLASEYNASDPVWFREATGRAFATGQLVIIEVAGSAKEEI